MDEQRRLVRVSAYGVSVREGRILLCHQVAPGPAQDKWTLPGGGLDFGETPEAAVRRECVEEAMVHVTLGALLGTHTNVYTTSDGGLRHGVRLLYAVQVQGEPRNPDDGEIDAVDWFDCASLPANVTEWAALGAQLAGAR